MPACVEQVERAAGGCRRRPAGRRRAPCACARSGSARMRSGLPAASSRPCTRRAHSITTTSAPGRRSRTSGTLYSPLAVIEPVHGRDAAPRRRAKRDRGRRGCRTRARRARCPIRARPIRAADRGCPRRSGARRAGRPPAGARPIRGQPGVDLRAREQELARGAHVRHRAFAARGRRRAASLSRRYAATSACPSSPATRRGRRRRRESCGDAARGDSRTARARGASTCRARFDSRDSRRATAPSASDDQQPGTTYDSASCGHGIASPRSASLSSVYWPGHRHQHQPLRLLLLQEELHDRHHRHDEHQHRDVGLRLLERAAAAADVQQHRGDQQHHRQQHDEEAARTRAR